jgi:tol-pal system protein YbgF
MGLIGRSALAALAVAAMLGGAARAETVADIRAELRVLSGQIQEIRGALVESGGARGLPADSASALTRLDQLEAELRRLTNRVEVLSNDLTQVIADASNRVGDIEFRLTELEGGDVSLLGAPEPLGGGLTAPAAPAPPPATAPATDGALAATERSDFEAAVAAADAGEHARAAALLESFLATYPGGPLAAEAQFRRGEALAAQSDWRGAARSFLDAFSGTPEGPFAPRALLQLAVSLGRLGQTEEACLTLTEIGIRYPGSEAAAAVAGERQALRCP